MNFMLDTLAVLPEGGEGATTAQVADALDIDRGSAIVRLNRLVRVGRARVAGPGTRNNPKRWWRLPESERLALIEVRLKALSHAAANVMSFLSIERDARSPLQQQRIDALGREALMADDFCKGLHPQRQEQ